MADESARDAPDAEAELARPRPERFDETYSDVGASRRLNELFSEVMGPFPPHVEPFSLVTREGLDRVFAELQLKAESHLVDLCCGRGGVGLWFAQRSGARVTGVDFSPEAISQAEQRAALFPGVDAAFVVADAAQTPLAYGSADALACIDALQMLPDKQQVLQEIARLLRPRGRAVITTWELNGEDAGVEGREPIRDIRPLIAAGGLRLVLREEQPEWLDRQTQLFDRAIAEDSDAAEPALKRFASEGRTVRPLTAHARRVLVVATRP